MGAAITLLVILTFSIIVVRIAAVTLRLTGVPADVARFQARSAFTGTGFTTSETESVTNHPIRRRVIGLLMLQGNIGLVSVLATFIVSFVAVENSTSAIAVQASWLLGTVVLLWFVALNPLADRLMCRSIGWVLRKTTSLGDLTFTELLQLAGGHSVAEHRVPSGSSLDGAVLSDLHIAEGDLTVLGIVHENGHFASKPGASTRLKAGDKIVLYASDQQHASLHNGLSAGEAVTF